MKKIVCLIACLALLVSCGGNQTKSAQASVPEDLRENRVELLVFYGAQRCATCHAIEDRSKELVESVFAEDLASGLLVYRTVDMTTPEGEALADRYEVASSSLILSQHLGEEESVKNLTRMAFLNARKQPEVFKEDLSKEIRDLLNITPPASCCEITVDGE